MKAHHSFPTFRKKIHGPVAQLVRALACHARGRGFEPLPGRQQLYRLMHYALSDISKRITKIYASVAQSVEQGTENPCVGGSIPPRGTTAYASVAQ